MRDSSNYARLLHLCTEATGKTWCVIWNFCVDDADIIRTINYVRDRYGYTLDAHGAAAYAARLQALGGDVSAGVPVVTLATGHPAKLLRHNDRHYGCFGRNAGKTHVSLMHDAYLYIKIPPTMPALRKAISKALHSNDNR